MNEPGIAVANKFASPALESFTEVPFTRSQIQDVASQQAANSLSMESNGVTARSVMENLVGTKFKPRHLAHWAGNGIGEWCEPLSFFILDALWTELKALKKRLRFMLHLP